MNKIITFLLFIVLTISSYCQQTYFYQLTKIHNNQSNVKVSGGQFITFIGDVCYESNYKGIGVGHGNLTKSANSTDKILKYIGNSYWGKDAVYCFSSDKSILNVSLDNDMVLVYKRTTPPNGVVTCSLIKEKQQNTGSSSSGIQPVYVTSPIAVGGQTPTTAPTQLTQPNTVTTPSKKWRNVTREVDCSFCHHSGKCSTCNGRGWCRDDTWGTGKTYNCPNCRTGWCTHCNGRGSITKTEMVYE